MITKVKSKKLNLNVIIYAALAVVVGLYIFFAAPNLNPLFSDGAMFWLVLITICMVIPFFTKFKLDEASADATTARGLLSKLLPKRWLVITLVVLWGAFLIVNIICTPLFFWRVYRDQLPEPAVTEFTSTVAPIDTKQIPIVDKELAATLADKKLGEKPSLGSQVRLGEPTMQNVNGELVWAIPLQHSGFFKWLANLDGAAGYIKVSATNLKDIEYVETYKIKIQPDCYFMHDLTRKARFAGGFFTGITDYSFELDDQGKPYWVVTTYKNDCGFTLPDANGVIIIDAETGASSMYKMDEIPEWVDRVQPEDFIINQINNKGEYIKGIFNFSNSEKYKTSQGDNIVYNNGKCYLFTGITSVGADESATGFYMVDMVTKEPVLYRMSGATEFSAMRSAQGEVQDLGYTATNPIILNVYDEPTYFMTLKDAERLIKKYAFVSVKDYSVVGVGDTMSEAKADYAKSMNDISDKPIFGEDSGEVMLSAVGTVDRINFTIEGDSTVYYFTLDGNKSIFKVDSSVSPKLPITRQGDSVNIKYQPGESIMLVAEFNNTIF